MSMPAPFSLDVGFIAYWHGPDGSAFMRLVNLRALFLGDERPNAFVLQQLFEIIDHSFEPLAQRRLRCPSERFVGLRNIGPALPRIFLRQRPMHDARARSREIDDLSGEFVPY